jgi:hypothetical protein
MQEKSKKLQKKVNKIKPVNPKKFTHNNFFSNFLCMSDYFRKFAAIFELE